MIKRCLFSYEIINKNENYSQSSLRKLHRQLKCLDPFPYSREEQLETAKKMAVKLSIQGVQPKLSVDLNLKTSSFELCQRGGKFIVKPQVAGYAALPENEDLSMRLARLAGVEVPWHGLLLSKDGGLSYVIKRFDRLSRNKKLAVEDFSQLIGATRTTKYLASMERLAEVIEDFCTYPLVEARKFFRQSLFSFLIGNEDLHIKNFSLIKRGGKVQLSPAYDLVNSTLALNGNAEEEMALELSGKKKGFIRSDFEVYASQHLYLTDKVINSEIEALLGLKQNWSDLIDVSFLNIEDKKKYKTILFERIERLET